MPSNNHTWQVRPQGKNEGNHILSLDNHITNPNSPLSSAQKKYFPACNCVNSVLSSHIWRSHSYCLCYCLLAIPLKIQNHTTKSCLLVITVYISGKTSYVEASKHPITLQKVFWALCSLGFGQAPSMGTGILHNTNYSLQSGQSTCSCEAYHNSEQQN